MKARGSTRAARRRPTYLLALAAYFAAPGAVARADAEQTARWRSAVSGQFDSAPLWDTGVVPDNNGPPGGHVAAVIDATGSPYTVTLGGGQRLDSLTLDSAAATLDLFSTTFRADAVVVRAGKMFVAGTLADAIVSSANPASVIADGYGTLANLTAGTDVKFAGQYTVRGGLSLNGHTMTFQRGFGSSLTFEGDQAIRGPGTLRLGDGEALGASNQSTLTISRESTVDLGTAGTFLGATPTGRVVNLGTVVATGSSNNGLRFYGVTNAGVIDLSSGNVTFSDFGPNTGTISLRNVNLTLDGAVSRDLMFSLRRTGGTLTIGGQLDNAGQTLDLAPLGTVFLAGTVSGGSLKSASPVSLGLTGSFPSLRGVAVDSPLTLRASGGPDVDLSGVTLHSALEVGGTSARVTIGRDGEPAMLTGDGQLAFVGGAGNLLALGARATIGAGVTVAAVGGDAQVDLRLGANLGTLRAAAGRTLGVRPGIGTNQGVIRVDAGGTLAIGDGWPFPPLGTVDRAPGSTVVYEGTYDNAGQTMDLTSTPVGPVDLGRADVLGGTIASPGRTVDVVASPKFNGGRAFAAATFDGVTLAADLRLRDNAAILVMRGLTLAGSSISLAAPGAKLQVADVQPISGTGQIVFDLPGAGFQNSVAPEAFGGTLTLGPGIRVRTGSGSGSVGVGGTVVNYGTVSAETPGQVLTVGSLVNHGVVRAVGGGTLALTAPWTTDGPIAVDASTVRVAGNAIRPSDLATLAFAGGSKLVISGNYDNAGSTLVVRDDARTVSLAGQATLSGGTLAAPAGGALQVEPAADLSTGARITGTVLNAPITLQPSTSTQMVGVTNRDAVTVEGARLALESTWANAGTIAVTRGGTLTLGGTPTALGFVSVTNSNLTVGVPANRSTLDGFQLSGSTIPIAGPFDNTGATLPVDLGTNTVRLAIPGTIRNGTVSAGDPAKRLSVLSGTLDGVTLAVGATQTATPGTPPFFQQATVRNGLTLAGGVTYALASPGQIPLPAQGIPATGSLVFNGTQTLAGSGELVFDVPTTFTVANSPAIVTVTAGSTLTIAPGVTVRTGAGGGRLGNRGATVANQGTIFSQPATSADSLPDIVIDGTFTNAGTLRAAGGRVALAATAALTNLAAGTLAGGTYLVDDNSTLDFGTRTISTNAATVRLAGPGSRFDALTPLAANAGQLSITGGRSFAAVGDLVNSGVLVVGTGSTLAIPAGHVLRNIGTIGGDGTLAGSVVSAGTLSPGASPGLLTIVGNLTDEPASVLDVEVGGPDLPRRADALSVTGAAHLAGTLSVSFYGGYRPKAGDPVTVEFLRAGSIDGSFSEVLLPPLPDGMVWDRSRVDEGVLVLVPEPSGTVFGLFALGSLLVARRRPRRQRASRAPARR